MVISRASLSSCPWEFIVSDGGHIVNLVGKSQARNQVEAVAMGNANARQ